MQDAVALANYIYEMKSLSPQHIHEALAAYKDERFPQVQEQYAASKMNAKLIYGQVYSCFYSFEETITMPNRQLQRSSDVWRFISLLHYFR